MLFKLIKLFLPLLIFLMIGIFLWRGLYQDPHELTSPLINQPVPTFSAMNLLAPRQALTQQSFKGHVTVLNVFATWCVVCQAEHAQLLIIKQCGLVQLVGLDYKDQRQQALAWLSSEGNPYDWVIDDPTGNIGINFGVYGTPETFLIDAQGIIRYKSIGAITPEVWRAEWLPRISVFIHQ